MIVILLHLFVLGSVPEPFSLSVLKRLGSISTLVYAAVQKLKKAVGFTSVTEVPSASALQVLRRLGSIFTSMYAAVQKLKKGSWLELQFSLADNFKLNVTDKRNLLSSATPWSTVLSTLIVQYFQDIPDDEEDTRSSHKYLNDLEEDYQARALLAKSKSVLAPSSSSGKNKGLIAETYDWDDEEVSSDENEVTEVKALMALSDEERVSVGKESAINGDWAKISMKKKPLLGIKISKTDLLSCQHVKTLEILKENQNLNFELLELTSITKTWLNSSNIVNQYINEQIPTQKKKIMGIDQLTKDTSSFESKETVFVKSLADNSDMPITNSNTHKSSETEDSTLPNQDTNEVPSNESQRIATNPLVIFSDSSVTDYDSADESSVCSTPLLPWKKLDWKRETLQAKNAESFKVSKNESSSALRSKTPTKRYQANPKESHLIAVKRIFRYLKGIPDLVCGIQNVQQSVAMSSVEAVNVATAGCCANILWMKSQLTDYDIIYEKDHALKGDIKLHFIPTQYQLADIFAKPLDEPTFKRLIIELGTNPHVLTKQTKSVSEGLETVLTQPITRKEASSVASQIKEENSSTIKLKDLVKLFTKSKLPCLLKVQELTNQLLILQSQEYKLKLEKNKAEDALLKAQPSFPNVEQLKELLKGEDATEYYLRFSQLLNDRSSTRSNGAYKVNTKFLNTLPDEWSKFVPTEFK
ncbi:hypothetical protein Tco_0018486 [Tanacetum coccineum]